MFDNEPRGRPATPYATDAKDPQRRTWRYMTLTYASSLSLIGLLSITAHLMLDRVILEQTETRHLVNISGQQRMLSQRSSSLGLEYLYTGLPETKQEAYVALERLNTNHHSLLQAHKKALEEEEPSPLSPSLQSMYFEPPLNVDAKLHTFVSSLTQALEKPWQPISISPSQIDFLQLARHDLLDGLHAIVGQYEQEGLARINQLRQIQINILSIVILTILIEAFFIFRPMVNRISYLHFKLQQEATHDALSGLLNRKTFFRESEQAISYHIETRRTFCLVLLDVDFFKKINDQYGHITGDKVIKQLGVLLQDQVRGIGKAARLGGEEFGLLLLNTRIDHAIQIAERVRQAVYDLNVTHEDALVSVRLSAGVTVFSPEVDTQVEDLYARADAALYKAKATGRNRVCVGY